MTEDLPDPPGDGRSLDSGDSRLAEPTSLSVDEIFFLLSERRRRYALRSLRRRGSPVALSVVATDVAAMEAGDEEPSAEHVSQVRVSLHHAHLPTLAEYGVAAFDAERGTITVSEKIAALVPFLERVSDRD